MSSSGVMRIGESFCVMYLCKLILQIPNQLFFSVLKTGFSASEIYVGIIHAEEIYVGIIHAENLFDI